MLMSMHTIHTATAVQDYLTRVRELLSYAPPDEQERLLGRALAEIELEADLRYLDAEDNEAVHAMLARLGTPERMAARIASLDTDAGGKPTSTGLRPCRSCGAEVSGEAVTCPRCGAPFPARARWTGPGYEYKSRATFRGWPLVHIAFGRDEHGRRRVARGVIAIGQFGIGAITIAQFGVGFVFGLGQFMLAPLSVGQFAFGLCAAGQFGIGLLAGAGQFATGIVAAGMKAFGVWTRSAL